MCGECPLARHEKKDPPMSAAADFLKARDFVFAHRTDYAAVRGDFHLPQLSEFNWALDHFDAMAAGNDNVALSRLCRQNLEGCQTR